jgi:phosphoglycerate dehydrogenase-like enzyme
MKILFLGKVAARYASLLRDRLEPRHEVLALADPAAIEAHGAFVEAAEIIVSPVMTPALATMARSVKLFQTPMAGLDASRLDLLPPGARAANTFNHQVSIAEFVMLAILMHSRRPVEADSALRRGGWSGSWIWGEAPAVDAIEGKAALIAGIGRIGREVARRAKAFGMRTVGISRRADADSDHLDRIVTYDEWEKALPEADFVVIACPLSERTRGLFGTRQFGLMKASAHLTNIARGEIVDEEALYQALRDRRIAGAAIDVWYRYPQSADERCLPSRYPFHELDNVLMTPHLSGWTASTVAGRLRDVFENIRRFEAGQPLINQVLPSSSGSR